MPWASLAVVNPKYPYELSWLMPLGPLSTSLDSGAWEKKISLLNSLDDQWQHYPKNIEMTPNSLHILFISHLYFSLMGQIGKQAKLRTQILMLENQFGLSRKSRILGSNHWNFRLPGLALILYRSGICTQQRLSGYP